MFDFKILNVFKTTTNTTGVVVSDYAGKLFDGNGSRIFKDATAAEKSACFTQRAENAAMHAAHRAGDHCSAHLYA